jgi:CBS domain containing-hemolysin-like protein
MIPIGNLIVMDVSQSADEALKAMAKGRMDEVFICNQDNRLLGIVSKTDIMNAAVEQREFLQEYSNSSQDIWVGTMGRVVLWLGNNIRSKGVKESA